MVFFLPWGTPFSLFRIRICLSLLLLFAVDVLGVKIINFSNTKTFYSIRSSWNNSTRVGALYWYYWFCRLFDEWYSYIVCWKFYCTHFHYRYTRYKCPFIVSNFQQLYSFQQCDRVYNDKNHILDFLLFNFKCVEGMNESVRTISILYFLQLYAWGIQSQDLFYELSKQRI